MGEVIKHGLIKDADYYEWIKENIDAIKAREHEAVKEMIYQSCLIKGGVVERDPKEKGERALLNFGHTLGMRSRKLKDFGTWSWSVWQLVLSGSRDFLYKREYQ